jgi:hypothetical protein
MNEIHTVKKTVNELIEIDWSENFDGQRSHIALMNEFLRRSALWAVNLDIKEKWPFFDIAFYINSAIRADPLECERLDAYLKKYDLSQVMRKCMINHLHWLETYEQMIENNDISHLPPPYEPIIVMFKRGGYFWLDSLAICVDLASLFRKPIYNYINFPALKDLNDDTLNILDL